MEIEEFWQAPDCERYTGIPAGTWRYWASTGQGPVSFRFGKAPSLAQVLGYGLGRGSGAGDPPRGRRRRLMSLPHINQCDRDAIEDRGLVDDDNTEVRTALALSGVGAPGACRS